MKNDNVNSTIDSKAIETEAQKKGRNFLDIVSTVLLVVMTLIFVACLAGFFAENKMEKQDAPTGDMMLSSISLYGLENVDPFDLVDDVAEYNVYNNKRSDSNANLACALAQYKEAAFYKYAYEYVGDSVSAQKYQDRMKDARDKLEVKSFADYIDNNYKNFSER